MPIQTKLDELFDLYLALENTIFSSLNLTDKGLHLQLAILIQDARIKVIEAYTLLKKFQTES